MTPWAFAIAPGKGQIQKAVCIAAKIMKGKQVAIRTLIVPDFSPFTSPPIVRPFIELGYQIVQLPEPNHASVDVGLKYTNNEICYPGIITLGDLVVDLIAGRGGRHASRPLRVPAYEKRVRQ